MPREGRKRSTIGWYYVIVQGDKGEHIFKTKAARETYESLLTKQQLRTKACVEVMILYENSVHLMIDVFDGDIASFMRPVQMSFSKYYRSLDPERERVFRDRYRSEAIESEQELAAVMKKLWQNWRFCKAKTTGPLPVKKEKSQGRMHRRLRETLHFSGGFEALYHSEELIDQNRIDSVLSEVPECYGMTEEKALVLLSERLERALKGRASSEKEIKKRLVYLSDAEKRELGRALHRNDHVPVRLICDLLGLSRGVAERL